MQRSGVRPSSAPLYAVRSYGDYLYGSLHECRKSCRVRSLGPSDELDFVGRPFSCANLNHSSVRQTQSWYVQLGKQQVSLGRDKEAAYEEYHRLMGQRTDGVPLETDSVARLLNRYLAWIEANRARPTFEKALHHLKSFGRKIGPDLKVNRLKPYHVQRWIDADYAKLSDTYKNAAITVVKGALNWCEQQGYIAHNPIAKMKKPTPAIREFFVPAVKWPEVLAAVRGQEFKDFVIFMLDSGARPQEVCRAEARHFDRENCRLVFPASESKGKETATGNLSATRVS